MNTNYAKAQVRVSRKLGKATVAIEAEVDRDISDQELGTVLYSRALLSARLLHSFKAYFGQQVSIDGWTYIVGFKASGIKVLFPWTCRFEDPSRYDNIWSSLSMHAAVAGLFLAANYFCTTLTQEKRRLAIEKWREKNLQLLEEKQTAFDALMEQRASTN